MVFYVYYNEFGVQKYPTTRFTGLFFGLLNKVKMGTLKKGHGVMGHFPVPKGTFHNILLVFRLNRIMHGRLYLAKIPVSGGGIYMARHFMISLVNKGYVSLSSCFCLEIHR